MADVRPAPGIRYAPETDLAAVVTPPYDVISPDAQARYYERSPRNIIRLELGRDEPDDDALNNRYTRAAVTFAEWRRDGILRQDAPSLYLYEQRFSTPGTTATGELRRLSLLARVRLEPWSAGVILPHERTMSKPKDDRLKLTRACAANLSPLMALYDDPQGELTKAFSAIRRRKPTVAFTDEAGEEHRLWGIRDAALAALGATVADFFRDRQLYIADGHHRYETALTYRDEARETRRELAADDAVNFTLMALSATEDPGLLVLPTHRIVRGLDMERLAGLNKELQAAFAIEPLSSGATLETLDPSAILDALGAASRNAQGDHETAFALVAPDGVRILRLTTAGRAAMEARKGANVGTSEAWRRLDVAALHELVLNQALGISDEAVRAGEHVTYTRDAAAAITAVRFGAEGAQLAILLNPTPPTAIRDVARAGDRMPQKSTYFYPKLITGLVINPLW